MKKHYLLALALFPLLAFGQLKQIVFSELTTGSGMFFGAQMTTTTITVTLQGPSDRFIAFGFGAGMSSGDAIIWSTLGTGAAPLQVRDHNMQGVGVEPPVDAQQDWTVTSNTVSGSNRTIVATRALNTGDANDVVFNFASTTQNLFWSHASSASTQLAYHGSTNRADGIVRNWVLVDQTPPTATTFTPADNAVGASLTNNLSIVFSENIAWGAGSVTLYNAANTAIQTFSNGGPGATISGATLTLNPTANLIVNTGYYVQVDPTAITDIAGNAFAGFTDNTTWNFNTNDVTPPVLTASPFVPADNATGVSLTTNLSATFNENVQPGTGVIELFDGSNTLVEAFDVASSPNVTVTNAVVTINPTSDLTLNQSYYVHIAPTAIHDLSGNNYAGITANTTWNFNTNDLVAPTVIPPFTPADDAAGVPVATNLVINFSEPVAFGTGNMTVFLANGTPFHVIDVTSTTEATISGSTVTVDLASDLQADQSYYVQIAATAVHDLSGNPFAGILNQTTWNFNTNTNTPPALAATPFVPADNATNVATGNPLTATFTENIQLAATGTAKLFLANGTLVESFGQASAGLSVVNDQLTITPTAALNESTAYYVTIDAGFITDLIGNAYTGFTDNATWNFTTGDFTAPTLISSSLSPADNATNVPLNTTLSMTFSEPVAFGTGIIHLNDLSGNSSTQQFDVAAGTGLSISGSTITVTPAALHLLTNYAVIIDATAVQDMSGNAFAGIADPTTWNFTSDDAQGLDELSLVGITWNGTTLTIDPTATVAANLYDASGKLIKAHLGQTTNCSDLTTGIYLLGLQSESTYQTVRLYVR